MSLRGKIARGHAAPFLFTPESSHPTASGRAGMIATAIQLIGLALTLLILILIWEGFS
jgi:hypothetical protein